MSERKDWRRAIGKNNLLDEAVEIDLIFRETAHVALAPIGQRAVRHSLPAPVQCCDCEAASPQVAHSLEIFLDKVRPSLKQANRALAARRWGPPRKTQRYSVGSFQRSRDDIGRHWIGRVRNEAHDC